MPYENYMIEALDEILGWNMSDEAIAAAVVAQATLMAGGECPD